MGMDKKQVALLLQFNFSKMFDTMRLETSCEASLLNICGAMVLVVP